MLSRGGYRIGQDTSPMVRAKSIMLAACAGLLFGAAALPFAKASSVWMSEQALRAELIGKAVEGHFRQGPAWTVTYFEGGRIDQHFPERKQKISGNWLFRGSVFCSLPDQIHQPAFMNSCWTVSKPSANCYEFFRVQVIGREPIEQGSRDLTWYGRVWRQDRPSTCQQKPSA